MIAFVLGTRPEIIKTAPVIFEAQRRNIPFGIIHTGQHYTMEMDTIFFEELHLPQPVAHVHVGSHQAPEQIGLMIQRLGSVFAELRPSAVMVQGDTNSVLAGALAAYKMGIPVAHLEAGLRSDDWSMPEEANRVLTDRLSRWLFCPTELQRERLCQEAISHDGVHVVGNTIVDAVQHFTKIAYATSDAAERFGVTNCSYALLTMHRPSNVDNQQRLQDVCVALHHAATSLGLHIVFPIHPRTRHAMERASIRLGDAFIATDPLGYLDLLRLQASADVVLTDSGGIQEEACILHTPCVTLRSNTERPETLDVGANVLTTETDGDALAEFIRTHMSRQRDWTNPFGDGQTARRVLDILL